MLSDILGDDQVPPAIRVRAAGIVMREDARRDKQAPEAKKPVGLFGYKYTSRDIWKTDQDPKKSGSETGATRPRAAV